MKRSIVYGILNILTASLALSACGGSDGANGTNGTNASVQTSIEPAGENCANGGIKIEVLLDGTIQDAQTQYICNGTNASIQTSKEPAGENCASGGVKIEVLQNGIVQNEQTQYICNDSSCQPGYHDGGDGLCVLLDRCSVEYHSNGLGECVPMGQCAESYHDGGDGACVPEHTCSVGYHDDGDGVCVKKVINIPAGSFTLTHNTGSYSSSDTVTLAAFKLGKTPVTVAEFKKCVEAGTCTSDHYSNYNVSDTPYCNYNRGDEWLNHPMNCVDWYGAKEYCEAMGKRLPTEEEWEYASTHNGTEHLNTAYPWGNDSPTSSTANYNQNVGSTTEVGRYSPAGDSPLGLVDMSGNVWEWTSSPYNVEGGVALKGGSWSANEYALPVTARNPSNPADRDVHGNFGFRCAE